jgi:outer membrane protein OmpA-like peptidoglycan-associated protein
MNNYVGANLPSKFSINSIGNKSGRYRVSKVKNEQYSAYLVIGVIDKYTDGHVIEVLYLDSDKSVLKASSKEALEITASLLNKRPELDFFVVGHTDSQGDFGYNMDLSKGRATAVMSALVNDYNIARSRLLAYGVGPLSPIASNEQAAGMSRNRRVMLVQQSR